MKLEGEQLRNPARSRYRITIAINRRLRSGAWGGGNQWLAQLLPALQAAGYAIQFDLNGFVDGILIAEGRRASTATFWLEEIRAYRHRYPHIACIHRVNENDQRKGTVGVDADLAEINALADYTIFVSEWLRDYHAARWFDVRRPHGVISNGADDRWFHPSDLDVELPKTLRLITHHWSAHWNKGFDIYQQIDRHIAEGKLPGVEFWVVGRWPQDICWRAARTFKPVHGPRLANLLRQGHLYVTASRWDPGPMHVSEALQCGLPVLYHADGGGAAELAKPFGVEFRDDVRSAVLEARERYAALRQAAIQHAPSGTRMCEEYQRVIDATIEASGNGRHTGQTRWSQVRVAVFLTRGISLQKWAAAGMLERELAVYRDARFRDTQVALLSYGGVDELQLLNGDTIPSVLPNRWGLNATLYSVAAPLLQRRTLREATVFKTHQLNGAWTGAIAKWMFRKPLIVRCGYVWSVFAAREGVQRWKRPLIAMLERMSLRAADAVIVATAADRDYLTRRYGLEPSRVRVIPNYVDTEQFRPLESVEKTAGLVCAISRLESQKNLAALLSALTGLPGVRLALVGEGSLRAALERQAIAERIPVEFLGYVPHNQLPALLNRAELFVLPSHYEGHPKALLEAMACGLPIIGADAPGIRDIIAHGHTGWLCAGSPEALREAITTLLGDAPLRRRLGQEARRYVERTCSLAQIAGRELNLITEVAKGAYGNR